MDSGNLDPKGGLRPETTRAPAIPTSRMDDLEGMRGVLAIFVVTLHLSFLGTPDGHWIAVLFAWVWICMDVFFCMSGYFIGLQILQNRHSSRFLPVYLLRRALRIWPVYFATLFTAWTISLAFSFITHSPPFFQQSHSWWHFLVFLQYASSYFPPHSPVAYGMDFFAHSWSVAIEEQFYLVIPVYIMVLLWIARMTNVRLRLGMLTLAFAAPVLGSLCLRISGTSWALLAARSDGFIAGLLIAWFKQNASKNLIPVPAVRHTLRTLLPIALLAIPSFCLFEVGIRFSGDQSDLESSAVSGISLSALLSALIIASCVFQVSPRLSRILRLGPLVYLGRISFSTYLWHLPLLFFLAQPMDRDALPFWLRISIALFFIYAVSHLSFKYIERPIERSKPRF